MIKTIKQTLIWLLTALLALAAVCLTVNPAKQTKADETMYILSFLDSDYTNSLIAYTRTGDSVFTEEDYNALTPTAVPGKVFAGWSVSSDKSKYSGVSLIGKTFLEIYNEQNAPSDYIVNFYPFFCEEDISFEVRPIPESDYKQVFNITLKYNQEITQDIIDDVFGVQGYSIEVCYAFGSPALGRIPVELRYTHEVSKFEVMYKLKTEYTITFMQDGAVKFTATAEKGKTLDLGGAEIDEAMKKDGYELKGYATVENGEIVYAANSSFTPTSDVTLYGVYVKVNTITFMQDGAVKFTATAETGKTLDLGGAGITSIMTKDGYSLKGYATAENGEIVYEADAVITPESDMTLYAVYEENKTPGDDETDKTGEQDKQNKKAVNVTGILVSIPLLALLAAGTVYLVGKIKKS